ncbi:MAG TPA: hypothetical protein DDZ68_16660 [Parvularcula sp.]|nr:hypothetical protein [Parvularcula sp.]HBS36705.1 hypothetical protein [Parvularcula sp.]
MSEADVASVRHRQKGAALLLVLWTALLLSVLLAGALGAARIEAKIVAAKRQQFAADLALDAALDLAASTIVAGEPTSGGAIVKEFTLNGFVVSVVPSIEGEKLDVNRAEEGVMSSFFRAAGLDPAAADRLAAEISDWRDEDDLPRPNGAEKRDYADGSGKSIGDRPFNGYGEIRNVLHMTPEIYECVWPALTIFGSGAPPSARVMALIGLPQSTAAEPLAAARLGSSARGSLAGEVHAIEAVAEKGGSLLAPQQRVRIFRAVGAPGRPFEQIAAFTPEVAMTKPCSLRAAVEE